MQFLISTARKSDSSLKMTIDLELVNNSNYQKLWSYLLSVYFFKEVVTTLSTTFSENYTFSFIPLFIFWQQVLLYTEPKGLHCFLFICAGTFIFFTCFFSFSFFFFLGDHLSPRQGCYPGNFLSSNRTSFYLETALILHLDTYSCYTFSFHK